MDCLVSITVSPSLTVGRRGLGKSEQGCDLETKVGQENACTGIYVNTLCFLVFEGHDLHWLSCV